MQEDVALALELLMHFNSLFEKIYLHIAFSLVKLNLSYASAMSSYLLTTHFESMVHFI